MRIPTAFARFLSALLVVAYAPAAYYTATHVQQSPWAVAIALGPLALATLIFVRKALGLAAFAAAALALPYLAYSFRAELQDHVALTYYLQHLGMMLCGALVFGLSLLGPRVPLCTRFARYGHEVMTDELQRYTRQVTLAWTLFFLAMAVVSSALFFSPLPFALWSAFDTLLTLPLVALMFAAEYGVRRCLLPHESGHGITGAYRAYQAYRADHAGNLKG